MESKEFASEKLKKILENVPETVLDDLLTYIQGTQEYAKLFRCTQMRDDVLRTNEDDSANRGLHTEQVALNASSLTSQLLCRYNGTDKLSEDDRKQELLAKIVGIAHDLGHTPMGHATEVTFGEKVYGNPYAFKHDQYSGVVFAKIFEEFLDKDDKLIGGKDFSPEERLVYIKSGLKEYIIDGVQNHGKYMSTEAKGAAGKDLPLICGRLADTLSFMPADLMDLANVDRAEGTGVEGKILTEEMMLNLVEKGITTHVGSTEPELPTEQLDAVTPIGQFFEENKPDFNYRKIISSLISGDKDKLTEIQAEILSEVSRANFTQIGNKENPIVSISDELKALRSAEVATRGNREQCFGDMKNGIPWGIKEYEKKLFREKYIKENNIKEEELDELENKEEFKKGFENYLKVEKVSDRCFNDYKDILEQETNELRRTCPTLALVYEMQDELIYNQILERSTKVLGNDEKINSDILKDTFDKFYEEYGILSQEDKNKFENVYKNFTKYMVGWNGQKQLEGKPEDLRAKAYAVYKLQSLSNDDIDRIRETEDLVKAMQELGMGVSLDELSEEGKESFKKGLLDKRKDGKETIEVDVKTGDGDLAPTQESSKIRVAVFGVESWKKIIGNRTVEDLQAAYSEVKEQSQKGNEVIEQGKNGGERDV